jgi:hypothetical protein
MKITHFSLPGWAVEAEKDSVVLFHEGENGLQAVGKFAVGEGAMLAQLVRTAERSIASDAVKVIGKPRETKK